MSAAQAAQGPESIATGSAILAGRWLWIPALAASRLDRNDEIEYFERFPTRSAARAQPPEQDAAEDRAENAADRNEYEPHQHAGIALEAAGLEDRDPGQPRAEADAAAGDRAEDDAEEREQGDLHGKPPG